MDQSLGSAVAGVRVKLSAVAKAELSEAAERLTAVLPASAVDLEVAKRLYTASPAQKYAVLAAAIALTATA